MGKCESCSKALTTLDSGEVVDGKLLCAMCLIKNKRNALNANSSGEIRYRNATERIESQIKKTKHEGYLGRGMLEVLSNTIPKGEDIVSIVKGFFSNKFEYSAVFTNRKFILFRRGFLPGTEVEDFNL